MEKIKNLLSRFICVVLCGIITALSLPGIPVSAFSKTYTYTFDDGDYEMGVGDTATVTRDGIKMKIQLMEDGSWFKIIKCEKLDKSKKPKYLVGLSLNSYSTVSRYPCMSILDISPKAFYKSKITCVNFTNEIIDTFKFQRVYGEKSFAECKKLRTIQNANAYTLFKKESFANCTNLKSIDIDYACSFEKNAFKNVKAEIYYDNVINPAVTRKNNRKLQKSLPQIKRELKKAGFRKGTVVKVYQGKVDKRGFSRPKTFKL